MSERLDRIEKILEENSKQQEENSKQLAELTKKQEEFAKQMQERNAAWEKQVQESSARWEKERLERNAAWEKQVQESSARWEKERLERNAAWEKEMKEERRLRKESNKKLESYITVESDIQEDAYYRTGQREIEEQGFIIIGQIRYDSVDKNVKGRSDKKVIGQYDVVFYNDFHIFIVEVKHKLRLDDFDQVFRHRETFPVVFPQYRDFKIHLGLACQSIPEHLISHAKAKGIYLLQPEADQIKVIEP